MKQTMGMEHLMLKLAKHSAAYFWYWFLNLAQDASSPLFDPEKLRNSRGGWAWKSRRKSRNKKFNYTERR